eukprot:gene10337-2751_t
MNTLIALFCLFLFVNCQESGRILTFARNQCVSTMYSAVEFKQDQCFKTLDHVGKDKYQKISCDSKYITVHGCSDSNCQSCKTTQNNAGCNGNKLQFICGGTMDRRHFIDKITYKYKFGNFNGAKCQEDKAQPTYYQNKLECKKGLGTFSFIFRLKSDHVLAEYFYQNANCIGAKRTIEVPLGTMTNLPKYGCVKFNKP